MAHRFGLSRRAALPRVLAWVRVRYRYLAPFGILLVALSLLFSSGVATASGTQKPATLKISGVPASVKEGGSFSVTASGYSGKFNALVFFPLTVGACKSTYSAQAGQQHGTYGVSTNHNFNTTAHIYLPRYRLGRTPGTYHFCVYLYKQFQPAGTQLHRSVTYRVTS
jgi:hypothetical protein